MKILFAILFFLLDVVLASAQSFDLEKLKYDYENSQNDTLKITILDSLALAYSEISPDSSYYYTEKGIQICRKLNFRLCEAFAMNSMGYALVNSGNYPRALQALLGGLQIAEDPESEKNVPPLKYRVLVNLSKLNHDPRQYRLRIIAFLNFDLGILYENMGNPEKALSYYSKALQLGEETSTPMITGLSSLTLGRVYLAMKKPDSAMVHINRAHQVSLKEASEISHGSVLLNMGRVYLALGDKGKAFEYLHQSIAFSKKESYFRGIIAANLLLSDMSIQGGRTDSGFYYADQALQHASQLNAPDLLLRCYNSLTGLYKSINKDDSTVKYQGLIIKIKDSLFNSKQAQQFQNIDFDAAQRQREIESAKKDYRNKVQKYALLSGLAIFLFTAIILWRNNRNKQRAYSLLKKQKEETDFQKTKVEKTLEELETTQAQLIQSEKMASLGELTAGIAHEIQNPLNFVNNFSEVSNEMIEEMKSEWAAGNMESANDIANDISQNLEKISHHGKRADAIVKGMLQHSRIASGLKEMTDVNSLAAEYLRLAYHGLRAKDKAFNANVETDFDPAVGKINIVPKDIGRVILNLINNAFYAVSEKQKATQSTLVGRVAFKPTVTVSTKKLGDKVVIIVEDNGSGIPQKVLDKIFQPFFTTKPTGQGTGLGLSLAYDIVKAHGGEIKVETEEHEGSEFIIYLPS